MFLFFSLLQVSSDQCSYWVLEIQAEERTLFFTEGTWDAIWVTHCVDLYSGQFHGFEKEIKMHEWKKHINGWLRTFIAEITSDILAAPVLVDLGVLGNKVNGAESVLLQAQHEYVEYLVSPITRNFLFIFFCQLL